MKVLIAQAYSGAKDLYFGIPDLDDAKFLGTEMFKGDTYKTALLFELKSGELFKIIIGCAL